MLRTRRRDCNVKPNRRLDRKSSRGMIYENEELRLKTININAEIERGQTDIKKLKRENEMLKKEIWCLRDEYEKLDKLLKNKQIEFSSASTTCSSSSDSEASSSCSSCTDVPEESEWNLIERSQNRENVQKTCHLKKLNADVDHLSAVPEESTTTENSSIGKPVSSPDFGSKQPHDPEEAAKRKKPEPVQPVTALLADQSYPGVLKPRQQDSSPNPKNFFSPIAQPQSPPEPQPLFPEQLYSEHSPFAARSYHSSQTMPSTQRAGFYQNMVLVPRKSPPSDANHLESMEKASTDLVMKLDNRSFEGTLKSDRSTFSNGGNLEELLNDIETISRDILHISATTPTGSSRNLPEENDDDFIAQIKKDKDLTYLKNPDSIEPEIQQTSDSRPFKSEINVTLMPAPMPLIGMDKYNRSLQCSLDSLPRASPNPGTSSRSLDGLETIQPHIMVQFEGLDENDDGRNGTPTARHRNIEGRNGSPLARHKKTEGQGGSPETRHKTLEGSRDSPVLEKRNGDKDVRRVGENSVENPFYFSKIEEGSKSSDGMENFAARYNPDNYLSVDKIEKITAEIATAKSGNIPVDRPPQAVLTSDDTKEKNDSKMSIRRKVSIHFRGKKKKPPPEVKFSSSSEGGCKSEGGNKPLQRSSTKVNSSGADSSGEAAARARQRKSASVSPDRTHKGEKKCHKKHRKGGSRRRGTTVGQPPVHRERSYSICTDRSNVLGFGLYYDSDPEESLSSCDTSKTRKMSSISNIPLAGKVPWCACWGNGCL